MIRRIFFRIFFSAFAALVFALPALNVLAQQQLKRDRPHAKRTTATAAENAALAQKRRAQGVSLLDETANAARSFASLDDRVMIQTLAADAMWTINPERARAIFRRAWEAATAADQDESEESARDDGAQTKVGALLFTESRDEVIAKAATRDSSLAEVFLKELSQEKADEQSTLPTQPTRRTSWGQLSANGTRRLALALDLLKRRDYDHAAQIALTLTSEEPSADLIAFLINLRFFKQRETDAIYLRLIERATTDTAADANTVLRLSSLFVSPELLVSVDERGSLQFRPVLYVTYNPDNLKSTDVSRAPVPQPLRDAFYRFAANVILRPTTASGVNQSGETTALFYVANRLLPFFEKDAAQFASAVQGKSVLLASEIEANRRDALGAQTNVRSLTGERGIDPLRPQTDRLARARDKVESEQASLSFIKTATRYRLWDRARRAADELDDTEVRRAALSFIAVSQVADISRAFADEDEEAEKIAQFVANADLPLFARAWGFAEAAQIAARRKSGKRRAAELLDIAAREAARVDTGTRERIAAYTVVAKAALRLNDWLRAWEVLPEIVKASNAVEDYMGNEDSLPIALSKDQSNEINEATDFSVASADFRIDAIFKLLARKDFDRAVTQANTLHGELPRALARIAIARAAFES